MKVNFIMTKTPSFKGVREDRNTVSQLRENNNYSLNEPNQRRINEAIERLAQQKGEENIEFLLDVAKKLKYQGHLPEKELPSKNEWAKKLKGATEESLAHSNPILREKYEPKINKIFSPKPLTKDEAEIDGYRKNIQKQINDYEKRDEINNDLDYFITSSETPIKQKKYIMKRLDYFMSPKYKINPQLKDKKPQILLEIVNDISVKTPDDNIPNIKAINQKTHGMCAAIAIVRKAVAYEDKPNYVDAILSELDDSDTVKVYDRQNLGSGKKVPVKKIYIDFDYAQQRGYRIVDASTLQWMNIGGMYGIQNENLHDFNAFDKNNFDAFHDSFFIKSMSDGDLMQKQAFFQALTKAKKDIGSVKSSQIKSDITASKNRRERSKNIDNLSKNNENLKFYINEIAPGSIKQSKESMFDELMQLAQTTSSEVQKLPVKLRKYAFIPNEEYSQKQKKIEQYFKENYSENQIDQDALSKKSQDIVETIEEIEDIGGRINSGISPAKKIAEARRLYEAESIYRASIVLGMLIKYNVPDRETRIIDGYDKVIKKIEKNNDKKLMKHFAPYFKTTEDDKEGIIEGLKEVKSSVEYLVTDGLDVVYKKMGFGDRREVLLNDMNDAIESIKNGDKEEIHRIAVCSGVKEDKKSVMKEMEGLVKSLSDKPKDQSVYVNAYNKMGYKNQVDSFIVLFKSFTQNLAVGDSIEREYIINNLKKANGLDDDCSNEDLISKISEIGAHFNMISESISHAANMLDVANDDGTPYFTVNEQAIITKKLEKEGKLVPISTMQKLQDRFAKIDKIRSSDEFASRQGKISDPSLYKLSKEEKAGIKLIEKNINAMYADVVRNLEHQYREIKEPLKEMAIYVGTNEGKYWVPADGESGLYGDQQVKIFEQITDRPYYEEEDIDKAVEKIKKGTHSGVSSSSVFHDRIGGHAQYVVDVVKDENTGKDILFHDNTWGAAEHENTWVDSNGLLRTDYSDHRGGEFGYITNSDWRNGNFVENLTHKKGHVTSDDTSSRIYKRIKPSSSESFDFSLMSGIIVEGKNPAYKDIAGSIKDEIFIPDSAQIKYIEKYAKEMTKDEIKKAIFRNKSITKYRKQYEEIVKRVTPTTFNKGITSEADYNALKDDDIVKVAFEKAAVRERFDDATMYKELTEAKNIQDIEGIRSQQRKIAYKDFQYSFYKGGIKEDVFLQAGLNNAMDFTLALVNALEKYDVEVSPDKMGDVLKGAAQLSKEERELYNGSVKNTIEILTKRVCKQYDENIPDSENSRLAKKEFTDNLSKVYEKLIYFNKEDLKSDTVKTKAIRQWIDDKFNPHTDEEFVGIYRNLQDMTNDEFSELTKNIDDKYIGIKDVKGYDILTKLLASNDNAEMAVKNVLFFDEYSHDITPSKTKPHYKNKKLERNVRGMTYVGSRSFDDLYRTMYFALNQLEYPKMFGKYAERNYRKYGAFPAYPKIDLNGDDVLNEKVEATKNLVEQTFDTMQAQKDCIYDIKLAHMLDEYRKSIPENRALTDIEQKTLRNFVGDFITVNATDTDMKDTLDAAYDLMELPDGVSIKEYNKYIDSIVNTVKVIENVNSVEDFQESNDSYKEGINRYFRTILDVNVPPRYHRLLTDDMKRWLSLENISRKQYNGIDSNKDMLDLQLKVSKNSYNKDKKGQIEGFVEIIDAVNNIKIENMDKEKNPDKIKEQLNSLHEKSDKYLDKYVKPEAKDNLRASFNDFYRKEIVGGKKRNVSVSDVETARDKFLSDFKKHHITSHPSDVIDQFLLLSAKDAEDTPQQKIYKKYLETELNLAKYISIQDSLMEAVHEGDASRVKEYFDEYNVIPYDGNDVVNMNSDTAIDYMIRSLLLDKNPQTAKMFVEKLGLGERVIKIELDVIKQINPKEKVDNIVNELKSSTELTNIVKEEYDNLLGVIDNSKNPSREINQTRRNIKSRTKSLSDKDSIKKFLQALDDTAEILKSKPKVLKSAIMASNMNQAFKDVNEDVNERVKEEQEYISVVNMLYNFLQNIQFPPYSKGIKLQKKVEKEQLDLAAYTNKSYNSLREANPDIILSAKTI